MKKIYNKKIIICCTIFCLALTFGIVGHFASSPNVLEADYPSYQEVSNITEAADVIVVGKVLDADDVQNLNINTDPQTRNSTDSIPYTISKIEVTNVITVSYTHLENQFNVVETVNTVEDIVTKDEE